jgi:hypothetical protein
MMFPADSPYSDIISNMFKLSINILYIVISKKDQEYKMTCAREQEREDRPQIAAF